jgi:hypothetical protein
MPGPQRAESVALVYSWFQHWLETVLVLIVLTALLDNPTSGGPTEAPPDSGCHFGPPSKASRDTVILILPNNNNNK